MQVIRLLVHSTKSIYTTPKCGECFTESATSEQSCISDEVVQDADPCSGVAGSLALAGNKEMSNSGQESNYAANSKV